MEVKGKIIVALPEQAGVSKAGNNWKKKEYVLEEIPEYVELQSNHAELETKYSTLLSDYEALKAEKDTLAEFIPIT